MVMPRRRRTSGMRFSTSLKVQHGRSQSDIAAPRNTFVLMDGIKPNAERTLGSEVVAGAHIFSMNVYVNALVPSGSGNTNFDYYVIYLRTGQTPSIIPDADFSAIGLSPVRNQIIFSDLNQIGTEDAGPMKRKVHIKTPKLYQRIREGDQWLLVYGHSSTVETNLGFRAKSFS